MTPPPARPPSQKEYEDVQVALHATAADLELARKDAAAAKVGFSGRGVAGVANARGGGGAG